MGLIPLGELLNEGATFSTFVYSMSNVLIPIVFGLWVAKWLYKILISLGGEK